MLSPEEERVGERKLIASAPLNSMAVGLGRPWLMK
jgi:hypothetical protein